MATPQPPSQDRPRSESGQVLNPAAVVLWRSVGVLQLELGSRRIVIDNVRPEQLSALLDRPGHRWAGRRAADDRPADRARPEPNAATRAKQPTGQGPELAELTRVLAAAGFLTDRPARAPVGSAALPAQFGPDLGALTGRHGNHGPAVLAARRRAAVAVHGNSRITTTVASTLASAGVGWVQLVPAGEVSAGESCPGGLAPADEGDRFAVAGVQAMLRNTPSVRSDPLPASRPADLVILTDPAPVEPSIRASLHLDGVAHLPASVDGSRAVIGPLVLPGVTSCLRCADLHRCERDPAWPRLAIQLAGRPRRRATSDVSLCVATAGLTAGQALAYLDRGEPETLNATLEWQLPDWQLRRRRWISHHDCDCGAATRPAKDGRMAW
ncbi:MAG TPA: hypothetical protein VFD94_04165 [Jatrophihabitans sp.]|nr:hypothetical protein [Jatrophihabitans sp.]